MIAALGDDGASLECGVNGSWGLGIPSNSPQKDEAWAYISYLTQPAVQDQYARLSLPIWKASYDNPEVSKDQEELVKAAKESIAVMYPRPLMPSYTELSAILQKNIHEVLLGSADPKAALDAAAERAARLR